MQGMNKDMMGIITRVKASIKWRIKKIKIQIHLLSICLDCFFSRIILRYNDIKGVRTRIGIPANKLFYRRQFVAHGRYHLPYPNNSLVLYEVLIEKGFDIIECDVMFTKDNIPILCHDQTLKNVARDNQGNYVDLEIRKLDYSKIAQYNFSIDSDLYLPVTTLKDLLLLAKHHNICIELDINKKYLGRSKCKILYNMVKDTRMLQNVIWEVHPSDFYSLAILDRSLIFQFDNTWEKKKIDKIMEIKSLASLIILSQWFPDTISGSYYEIIKYGHSNGFLMKCATLNKCSDVNSMFSSGVDLITTDTLLNTY